LSFWGRDNTGLKWQESGVGAWLGWQDIGQGYLKLGSRGQGKVGGSGKCCTGGKGEGYLVTPDVADGEGEGLNGQLATEFRCEGWGEGEGYRVVGGRSRKLGADAGREEVGEPVHAVFYARFVAMASIAATAGLCGNMMAASCWDLTAVA
jgi:hypothetical protein